MSERVMGGKVVVNVTQSNKLPSQIIKEALEKAERLEALKEVDFLIRTELFDITVLTKKQIISCFNRFKEKLKELSK